MRASNSAASTMLVLLSKRRAPSCYLIHDGAKISPLRPHERPGRLTRLPVPRGEISIVIGIEGDGAPGFEGVREVFGKNFENNGDVGAAVCVYRHGRKVVVL